METLKVFTITDDKIIPGASITAYKRNGNKAIPTIAVGEDQWYPGKQVIPVILNKKEQEAWERKKSARIYYARLKRCLKLSSIDYSPDPSSSCLVIFQTDIGQGGGNAYRGDLKENLKNYHPFPGRILKRGKVGHRFLGQVFTGLQIIAIIDKGKVFSFIKHSEMPFEKQETFFCFDGHEIHKKTKEERLNYSLFPESRC